MKLYENIKRKRIELGISQQELANRVGYKSRSTINKIEMGINDITQSKIVDFAKALGVAPGDLMGWEEKEEPTVEDRELNEKEKDLLNRVLDLSLENRSKLSELIDLYRAHQNKNP